MENKLACPGNISILCQWMEEWVGMSTGNPWKILLQTTDPSCGNAF
jgi:hypothetical protein